MSEMAWRYLYSTAEKGAEYQCTKCGYKITAKFGAKIPPCPNCLKHEVKCENCKWFKHHDDYKYNGNCCRYPKWMLVSIDHYCGEWEGEE